MAQQTAIDFLVELLPQIDWDDLYYRGIWQEAKDIEKEQIVDAHYQGYRNDIGTTDISEQYYNETYGE